MEREIEDIEALIDQVGGRVYLYGFSSGSMLALKAAARLGDQVARLALYEPPFNSRDDEIVPFAHLALYAAKLPQATIREVDGRGHQFGNDLADVAEDIMRTETYDDDLRRFEADGAAPLPDIKDQGFVEHDGARIWFATYGSGPPVILLHGGLGHSGNWGYQVPALVRSGYRAVLIDSRGHGHSTRDTRPFTYERMASDVLAMMDALNLEKAGLVGWSDGACTALVLASKAPARVAGVFFFACNMDPSGVNPIKASRRKYH